MRYENGLVRQPKSSSGRARGGLLIVTAICCVFASAWPSTVWAQDTEATLPAELRPLEIARPALPEEAAAKVADLQTPQPAG